MKKSMYAFKYSNRREYASFYAKVLVKEFGGIINSFGAQALVPVPLYRSKERKRGYNQAEVLATELSKLLGIPVDRSLIRRVKNTVPLKTLSTEERKNNIRNAFQIRRNGLKYSKIVIVDDIYTTGTTIDECAAKLIESGINDVYFITACIGNGF